MKLVDVKDLPVGITIMANPLGPSLTVEKVTSNRHFVLVEGTLEDGSKEAFRYLHGIQFCMG